MNVLLTLPYDNVYGNLLWMPPYLYPFEDLDNGMEKLRQAGYWVGKFPEGDRLTYIYQDFTPGKVLNDLSYPFPWMKISLQKTGEPFDVRKNIADEQIVLLPVGRLEINESIVTDTVCLFPAGHFATNKINFKNAAGKPLESKDTNRQRDLINDVTGVNPEVFKNYPLLVIKDKISLEKYFHLSH